MMKHPSSQSRAGNSGQGGMTLIEVLVSILVFSFGLLGFVGLQARATQYSVSAEDSNRAAILANEMASTMVTNSTIDTTSLSSQIAAWQARVSDGTGVGLTNGLGDVTAAGNVATITITWRAPGAVSGAANSTNKYVTQVLIP
jgi:type IV pilus assembly protein PilV